MDTPTDSRQPNFTHAVGQAPTLSFWNKLEIAYIAPAMQHFQTAEMRIARKAEGRAVSGSPFALGVCGVLPLGLAAAGLAATRFRRGRSLGPRFRNIMAHRIAGEIPENYIFLARTPREKSAAIVDDGRETDQAGRPMQDSHAQRFQFRIRLPEILLHGGNFLLKLIAAREAGPGQRVTLTIETFAFGAELGELLVAVHHIVDNAANQRQHGVTGTPGQHQIVRARSFVCLRRPVFGVTVHQSFPLGHGARCAFPTCYCTVGDQGRWPEWKRDTPDRNEGVGRTKNTKGPPGSPPRPCSGLAFRAKRQAALRCTRRYVASASRH